MRVRIRVVGALLLFSTLAHGQQGLPGTYEADFSGFSDSGREWSQRVTLVITSAENGKIAGKYNVPKYSCAGDYLIVCNGFGNRERPAEFVSGSEKGGPSLYIFKIEK